MYAQFESIYTYGYLLGMITLKTKWQSYAIDISGYSKYLEKYLVKKTVKTKMTYNE